MTNEELFAGTAVSSWKNVIGNLNKLFASLSDDELQREVAPKRNRAYYVLGHLVAVHDRLFPLLGLGDRLHPELDEAFILKPDRTLPDKISASDLRQAFLTINQRLTAAFEALPAADWLKRHESVSEEDFAKEPLRNRMAVLLSRTDHAAFHAGQIRLITK